MKSSRSSASGFTLVEILIVLTIAGILAAMAVPSFRSMMESQRVNNASFELFAALSLARSEAIKRNGYIIVTGEPSWSALSSIEVAVSGVSDPIASKAAPKGVAIRPSTAAAAGITYERTGRTSAAGNSFEIDVAGAGSPTAKALCVTVELSGMPRTRKGACP